MYKYLQKIFVSSPCETPLAVVQSKQVAHPRPDLVKGATPTPAGIQGIAIMGDEAYEKWVGETASFGMS